MLEKPPPVAGVFGFGPKIWLKSYIGNISIFEAWRKVGLV